MSKTVKTPIRAAKSGQEGFFVIRMRFIVISFLKIELPFLQLLPVHIEQNPHYTQNRWVGIGFSGSKSMVNLGLNWVCFFKKEFVIC